MKTILVDARNTFVTETGVNKEMEKLLDKFPNKKIIVTNANDEQMKTLGIVNMPYEVFSLKHNPDKTDPLYFTKFVEQYQIEIKNIIYFEHNKEAVHSASSLGITSYHYDKDKKNLEELKTFLENNI